MPPLFTTAPQSLCLLRLSAIGDCTHMLPIVHTLQRHWPQTRLTWIVGRTEAALVGDLPGVEFITFDKQAGLRAYLDLYHRLAGRRFDALLLMQVACAPTWRAWPSAPRFAWAMTGNAPRTATACSSTNESWRRITRMWLTVSSASSKR